ncbi:MAG: transposase, partial [Bacteroidetes bacterium]|nr:transposase [Bacteroidota bacterium]
QFLEQKQNKNQSNQIEVLEQVSPITWSHINLYGKYNFSSTSNNTISIEKLNCILESINLVR